jgi:hypothetical protein
MKLTSFLFALTGRVSTGFADDVPRYGVGGSTSFDLLSSLSTSSSSLTTLSRSTLSRSTLSRSTLSRSTLSRSTLSRSTLSRSTSAHQPNDISHSPFGASLAHTSTFGSRRVSTSCSLPKVSPNPDIVSLATLPLSAIATGLVDTSCTTDSTDVIKPVTTSVDTTCTESTTVVKAETATCTDSTKLVKATSTSHSPSPSSTHSCKLSLVDTSCTDSTIVTKATISSHTIPSFTIHNSWTHRGHHTVPKAWITTHSKVLTITPDHTSVTTMKPETTVSDTTCNDSSSNTSTSVPQLASMSCEEKTSTTPHTTKLIGEHHTPTCWEPSTLPSGNLSRPAVGTRFSVLNSQTLSPSHDSILLPLCHSIPTLHPTLSKQTSPISTFLVPTATPAHSLTTKVTTSHMSLTSPITTSHNPVNTTLVTTWLATTTLTGRNITRPTGNATIKTIYPSNTFVWRPTGSPTLVPLNRHCAQPCVTLNPGPNGAGLDWCLLEPDGGPHIPKPASRSLDTFRTPTTTHLIPGNTKVSIANVSPSFPFDPVVFDQDVQTTSKGQACFALMADNCPSGQECILPIYAQCDQLSDEGCCVPGNCQNVTRSRGPPQARRRLIPDQGCFVLRNDCPIGQDCKLPRGFQCGENSFDLCSVQGTSGPAIPTVNIPPTTAAQLASRST